jgi:hypothetical protein
MRRKLRETFHGNIPHRYRNCFASIDGKRFEISCPAGPNNQQYYAYNTYYAYHQLGYQSVVAPDGLIIHFSGPHSGCGNDLNMLADSRFIRELQLASNLANVDIQLDVIVDKIYNILTRGIVSLRKDPTNNNEREEDRAGSKFRIPVEWNFGKINLHFPFVNIYFRLKINEREVGTYINAN